VLADEDVDGDAVVNVEEDVVDVDEDDVVRGVTENVVVIYSPLVPASQQAIAVYVPTAELSPSPPGEDENELKLLLPQSSSSVVRLIPVCSTQAVLSELEQPVWAPLSDSEPD
jgi:hypothetical protein